MSRARAVVQPEVPRPRPPAAEARAPRRRLRVLFASKRFLLPMDTGGKIRTGKILEQLKDTFDITLVSSVERARDDRYLGEVGRLCHEFHGVPWTEVPKYTPRFYGSVLRRTLSRYPVTVIGDYSRPFAAKLEELAATNRYDLLVCDFLQPSINFRGISGYPTLLFQHNVESEIMRRHFETARNPLLRLFWRDQWRKMTRYEAHACRRFTGVVVVSETDGKLLQQEFGVRHVFPIPTGVDTEYFRPAPAPVTDASLIFTGAMDWLPNEDAIIFFADQILPRVKARVPSVTLTVVGRNPSRHLRARLGRHPEVTVTGWVEDVRPFIEKSAVYTVPLRIGGGTRIKLYEAMAMGKAVVSTPIGAEGLPLRHGEHVLLATEPDDFAAAVVGLLEDRGGRVRLERTARRFVEENFSWGRAAQAFADACDTLAHV